MFIICFVFITYTMVTMTVQTEFIRCHTIYNTTTNDLTSNNCATEVGNVTANMFQNTYENNATIDTDVGNVLNNSSKKHGIVDAHINSIVLTYTCKNSTNSNACNVTANGIKFTNKSGHIDKNIIKTLSETNNICDVDDFNLDTKNEMYNATNNIPQEATNVTNKMLLNETKVSNDDNGFTLCDVTDAVTYTTSKHEFNTKNCSVDFTAVIIPLEEASATLSAFDNKNSSGTLVNLVCSQSRLCSNFTDSLSENTSPTDFLHHEINSHSRLHDIPRNVLKNITNQDVVSAVEDTDTGFEDLDHKVKIFSDNLKEISTNQTTMRRNQFYSKLYLTDPLTNQTRRTAVNSSSTTATYVINTCVMDVLYYPTIPKLRDTIPPGNLEHLHKNRNYNSSFGDLFGNKIHDSPYKTIGKDRFESHHTQQKPHSKQSKHLTETTRTKTTLITSDFNLECEQQDEFDRVLHQVELEEEKRLKDSPVKNKTIMGKFKTILTNLLGNAQEQMEIYLKNNKTKSIINKTKLIFRRKRTTLKDRSKTAFDHKRTTKYSKRFLRLLHRRRPDLWSLFRRTTTTGVPTRSTVLKCIIPDVNDQGKIEMRAYTLKLSLYRKVHDALGNYFFRDRDQEIVPHQEVLAFLTDVFHVIKKTEPTFPPWMFTYPDNTQMVWLRRHGMKKIYTPKRDLKRRKTTTPLSTTLSKWAQIGTLIVNYFWTTKKLTTTTVRPEWFTLFNMRDYFPKKPKQRRQNPFGNRIEPKVHSEESRHHDEGDFEDLDIPRIGNEH
uniref:Uncharacterized protein n=1 Tax=Cacopsylla melanoneura TaxID=428564 RepID=A0A8D8T5Y0_9HEMI